MTNYKGCTYHGWRSYQEESHQKDELHLALHDAGDGQKCRRPRKSEKDQRIDGQVMNPALCASSLASSGISISFVSRPHCSHTLEVCCFMSPVAAVMAASTGKPK